MRKNDTKNLVTVYPLNNGKEYTNEAIYHIYKTLEVTPPDFCMNVAQAVEDAKAKADLLSRLPKQSKN